MVAFSRCIYAQEKWKYLVCRTIIPTYPVLDVGLVCVF
ncbi:hypothetical protein T4B_3799 [Trichinella pseudospiralis]|uniref:Uncharacterized protein n=1 Tax=Trichinella pseudospiralis TaxID=6337 RepID=A0A0V1G9Y2_TRIPS|nr:hypothetical protein T4B_3799 [Trichinella pseudospiralis]KRY99634.1 hypothetical protein T4C_7246 [Trichinella pseudospiralis]